VAQRWRDGEYLLEHYGSDVGDVPITYVNFHWYVSDDTPEGFRGSGDYTDTDALRDVVRLVEETTGKRAVTNEIGQSGRTPAAATTFLSVLRERTRRAVGDLVRRRWRPRRRTPRERPPGPTPAQRHRLRRGALEVSAGSADVSVDDPAGPFPARSGVVPRDIRGRRTSRSS